MHRGAWAVLVALALLATAPTGLAQTVGDTTVDLGLPTFGNPLAAGQTEQTSANVRYSWNNGMTSEPTTIRLEVVEEPEWLNTTFLPDTFQVNNTTQTPSKTETRIVDVNLSIDEDAPAFAERTATYRVVAEENPPLEGAEDTTELDLAPGFRGTVDATLPEGGNVTAWGGLVTEVPIEVTNRANGPVSVQPSVVLSPADAEVQAPEEFRLNASPDDPTRTVHLAIEVPWSVSIDGDVAVELSPRHAERGTEARTVEVGFHLQGNSAVPVPSPAPLAVLALVALTAAARAGRRAQR